MQTKKRVSGRIAAQEHAAARVSRTQKKASEIAQVNEKKVSDIITSSARKKKPARTLPKKNGESNTATTFSTRSDLQHNENSTTSLEYDANNGASLDCKVSAEKNDHHMVETIFSPAFLHMSSSGGNTAEEAPDPFLEENNVCHYTLLMEKACPSDMEVNSDTVNERCNGDLAAAHLSTEVSAIYLAMKNSKLECVDEQGQDSMSIDACVEDDCEDYDDFDPYLFMKHLPDLSSVVPTFRPMLLPKKTRSCPSTTLVLDLDETLVHSTLEHCEDADFTFPVNFNCQEHTVYVRCRPHLKDFMERVSSLFEIIIFTASQSIYAEQLLNVLDPKRKIFRHRVYRESCVFVEGNYLKDLSVLGRDLAHVAIIDNSPQAFGFQVDNGIPIESWYEDQSDQEFLLLLPFLESLVDVEDVRPLIAQKFNIREKIAAAVYNPVYMN